MTRNNLIHLLLKSADRIFNATGTNPVDRWKNEVEHFFPVEFKDGEKAQIISGLTELITFYRLKEKKALLYLKENYYSGQKHKAPVCIIAGSGKNDQNDKTIEPMLKTLLLDFKGTVISGGTGSGVPGMTGRIASELQSEGLKSFELAGYTPAEFDSENKISGAYDRIICSAGSGFSFAEVLCYWTDLIFSDIDMKEVFLLGIEGGKIALLEYEMALAMGIRVFLVKNSKGAVKKIQSDSHWSNHQNLHFIPEDVQDLSAWLNTDSNKGLQH